jgi:uncharacterized protein (UPF0332 family)
MHRDLVQAGLLPPETGRDYDFLMDMRETGDYGGLMQVTSESAQTTIEKASAFIEALRRACPELG